jgi:hypothetical protein
MQSINDSIAVGMVLKVLNAWMVVFVGWGREAGN